MFANLASSIKQFTFSETVNGQKYLVRALTWLCIGGMYLFLPLLPLVMLLLFWRAKYLSHYRQTIRKLLIHIQALNEGPVSHYFQDVIGRVSSIPEQVQGSCTQCGNCCMERRCVFLEDMQDGRYQCGIYHSPWRRLSNCGSFPLNADDIKRYACPGYVVVQEAPIHWVKRTADSEK